MIEVAIRLTGKQHRSLREHLLQATARKQRRLFVAGRRAAPIGKCCVPAN